MAAPPPRGQPHEIGHQDLPALRRRAESRRLDHRYAEAVVPLPRHVAEADADADRERRAGTPPAVRVDRLLHRDGGTDGVRGASEGRHDPVAGVLHHRAVVRRDGVGEEPVVRTPEGDLAPGVRVHVTDEAGTYLTRARTDEDGAYEAHVPPGDARVQTFVPGLGLSDAVLHERDEEMLSTLTALGTQLGQFIDRSRTEEALKTSEARYRRIVETTREGVWTVDSAGRTTFVNRRMAEMIGDEVEEMIGRPLVEFTFAQDAERVQIDLTRLREGRTEQCEFRFRCRNGSALWALLSSSRLMSCTPFCAQRSASRSNAARFSRMVTSSFAPPK